MFGKIQRNKPELMAAASGDTLTPLPDFRLDHDPVKGLLCRADGHGPEAVAQSPARADCAPRFPLSPDRSAYGGAHCGQNGDGFTSNCTKEYYAGCTGNPLPANLRHRCCGRVRSKYSQPDARHCCSLLRNERRQSASRGRTAASSPPFTDDGNQCSARH